MAFSGDQPNLKQIDLSIETGTGTNAASGSIMFHSTSGLIQHRGGDWSALTATTALDDVTDVSTAGHVDGRVLASNGSTFVFEALTLADQVSGAINDLTDVSTAGVATDEVLIYNGSSYIFEALVAGDNVTVAISGISNLDTSTNSPESTAGLSLVSDGDATYSFAEMTTARLTVTNTSSAVTAAVNNMYIIDTVGGVLTATLPATHASGDRVLIKCAGSSQTNAITIATADADTIDGEATQTLSSNFGAVECVSNGTNWFLV
jgi:hypothetical protein